MPRELEQSRRNKTKDGSLVWFADPGSGWTIVMMVRTHNIYRGHGWCCPPTAWIKSLMDPCTFIIAIGYDAMMSMVCKFWLSSPQKERDRESEDTMTACMHALSFFLSLSLFRISVQPTHLTLMFYFSLLFVIPQCIVLTSQVSTQEYRRLCRCRGEIQQEGFP